MPTRPDWLEIDYRTLYRLNPDGRIERENDPDRSPGPRLWLARGDAGNRIGVHVDLPSDIDAELKTLAADEPPFSHPQTPPRHLERYKAVLERQAPVTRCNSYCIYELPHGLEPAGGVRLVDGDAEEGQALTQSLARDGMPAGLAALGFRDAADWWRPWCAAIVEGEVASIAFATRLSDAGAELGVATASSFRGRGLAAAATAGWSRLRSLRSRALFYSADLENTASRRVAAKLGSPLRGASLRVA